MNPLESYITRNALDPIETMNRLTEAGIVSYNAIGAADVEQFDCMRACQWLEKNPV